MRCFVAVDLDENLKDKVVELQRQIPGDVKLVEPENLHFTLKFLGEVNDEVLVQVKAYLKAVASPFSQFDVHIYGTGVFPNLNYIRVVWIGSDDLLSLQSGVEAALAPLFRKEKPVAHLTIARIRSADGIDAVKRFVDANKDVEIGSMHVDKIKLKKSTLTPKGPIYEDLETFTLHKA